LEAAFDHKNGNRFPQALKVLKEAISEYPESSFANWLAGTLLSAEMEQPAKAIAFFHEAVRLNPKSEKCSLGLFHALWNSLKLDDALVELRRYQTLTGDKCGDYRDIMEEIGDLSQDEALKADLLNQLRSRRVERSSTTPNPKTLPSKKP